MDEKKISELIEGSRYSIKSLTTKKELLETEGIFRGYVKMGRRHGLRIEVLDEDEEHIRLIPLPMVSYIDVIEEAEASEVEDELQPSSYHG